jgi:hypothetical protein
MRRRGRGKNEIVFTFGRWLNDLDLENIRTGARSLVELTV